MRDGSSLQLLRKCCTKHPPSFFTSAIINHQPLLTLKWLKWIISCVHCFFSLSEFMFTFNRSVITVSVAVSCWRSSSGTSQKCNFNTFFAKNVICNSFLHRSSSCPVLARDLLSLSLLPSWTLAAFPCWLMSQGLCSCQTTPQSQPDSLLKWWVLMRQKGWKALVLFP